jgi:hypothetical protein
MSNLENANFPRPVSPQSPWTWGFMDTALISLIAYGVYTLVSGLTLTILAVPDGAKTLSPAQFQADGAAYIIACPLTVVVLWIAIRNARRDFAEYLALNWPSSGQLLRALASRRYSQSFLGPVGSIVLTSVLWGMIHTQYD